ncbi:MAG: c-type cytochrome [Chloroflexota bacterium]
MGNSLKVSAFVIMVVVLIAGFASLIPQLESPAPETLQISGDLSGAELADLGRSVLESPEAGCLACHGLGRPGLRAPDLAGVGGRAATTVPGQSAEEYLHESLVNPCAFVVSGFDCIMPQTLLQTLGPAKITALVAFLQSQGGEITVSLSAEDAAGGNEPAPPASVGVAGTTAEEIITALACGACHTITAVGAAGQVGPDLSQVGARRTADELRQSILTPDAVIAEECPTGDCPAGVMPKDFGQRLTAVQLETLVTYLSGLK